MTAYKINPTLGSPVWVIQADRKLQSVPAPGGDDRGAYMITVPDPIGVHWPIDVITEHVRTIWTGTLVELEQAAKDAGCRKLTGEGKLDVLACSF